MRPKLKFVTLHDVYVLCVIGLIKVVDGFASPRLARFFARATAVAAWQLSRRRRRIRALVLTRTLGTTEVAALKIVKTCFYEFWHGLFTLAYDGHGLAAEVRGVERLQNALANDKGVILWESQSFGKRVLAKRILHQNGFSVCQLHGREHLEGFRNSRSWTGRNIIRPFFENREKRFVKEVIHLVPAELSTSRALLQRLRKNCIVCVSADGKQGRKFISAQFLGFPDVFPTGLINLARVSGATILPLFCIQQNGSRATLVIERPISIQANGDRASCLEIGVREYVGLLESYIRRYPEQYLWSSTHESLERIRSSERTFPEIARPVSNDDGLRDDSRGAVRAKTKRSSSN
jgi:lauroyl/myristoyl acyltransferase